MNLGRYTKFLKNRVHFEYVDALVGGALVGEICINLLELIESTFDRNRMNLSEIMFKNEQNIFFYFSNVRCLLVFLKVNNMNNHPSILYCVTLLPWVVSVPAKSLQSYPTLCNPMNCSPPGSSVHGILQARILEWVAMPSFRGSSQRRDHTHISCVVSCIAGRFFSAEPSRKPHEQYDGF